MGFNFYCSTPTPKKLNSPIKIKIKKVELFLMQITMHQVPEFF